MAADYASLISILKSYGTVLTEHVGDDGEVPQKDRLLSDRQIFARDMEWLESADVVVAEVTVPSLGVGYELGRAHELGKPVLCLFNKTSGRELSAIIGGSRALEVRYYTSKDEFPQILEKYLSGKSPFSSFSAS